MINMLNSTVSDTATFWAAVEALATLGALLLLLRELPKIKHEVSAHKVDGLRFAREVLQSPAFATAYEVVRDAWRESDREYPSQIDDFTVATFSKLDLVATLAEEGYVDKRLLLYEFGDDLYNLERFITNFEYREGTKIPGIRARFPKAYDLLKDAAEYSRKESDEAFRRQDRYQREVDSLRRDDD